MNRLLMVSTCLSMLFACKPMEPKQSLETTIRFTPEDTTAVSQVQEIKAQVTVKGQPQSQELTATFVTPRGTDYMNMTATLISSDGGYLAEFSLPVSGTPIDTRQVSGTWTLLLSSNGKELSRRNFELTP